jgi:hypothetical protein
MLTRVSRLLPRSSRCHGAVDGLPAVRQETHRLDLRTHCCWQHDRIAKPMDSANRSRHRVDSRAKSSYGRRAWRQRSQEEKIDERSRAEECEAVKGKRGSLGRGPRRGGEAFRHHVTCGRARRADPGSRPAGWSCRSSGSLGRGSRRGRKAAWRAQTYCCDSWFISSSSFISTSAQRTT